MCFRSSVILRDPTLARSVRRKFVPVFMIPRMRTWRAAARDHPWTIGDRHAYKKSSPDAAAAVATAVVAAAGTFLFFRCDDDPSARRAMTWDGATESWMKASGSPAHTPGCRSRELAATTHHTANARILGARYPTMQPANDAARYLHHKQVYHSCHGLGFDLQSG